MAGKPSYTDNSVKGIDRFYQANRRRVGFEENGRPFHQEPQHPENKHGANYWNDASGWVRGAHGEPTCYDEDATGKPHFDHRGKDGYPKKW
jgi:hypothetical protein